MTHILLQISIGFVRSHNNVQTPLLWHSSNLKRGLIMHYQLHEIITLAIAQAHTSETLEQLLPNTTRNPIKGSYTHSCWKFFEISKTMYFGTKIEPSTTPHPTKKGLFHPFSSTCSLSTTFLSTSLLPHATYSMDLDAHIMHIILLFLSTPLPYYFYNIINSRKHNPYHSSKKKREENFTEVAPFTSSSTWAFTPIHVHLSQVSSGFPSNKYHMYLSLEDLVLLHLMINL